MIEMRLGVTNVYENHMKKYNVLFYSHKFKAYRTYRLSQDYKTSARSILED